MSDFAILIVDDEMPARFGMQRALSKDDRFTLHEAESAELALSQIEKGAIDLVLMDINMPGIGGMQALKRITEQANPPLVIMVTAYGSEKLAVEAMKQGAYHYIAKPYDVDELRHVVEQGLARLSLARENRRLIAELRSLQGLGELIGTSDQMRTVFELIHKIKDTDVTVLVTGESGTGKELVAREIHSKGNRSHGPFITMNCAAVPENLIESELFGHERGAFTGATESRAGKFELADGGVLFLDEIGDMSLNTQAKVLRAIQEREFQRLGGSKTHKVDVRLISATHKDLEKEMDLGTFRKDLYYRIKVVDISLPALRERPTDIPMLVGHFLEMFCVRHKRDVSELAPEAIKLLIHHSWPGNVRELKNVLEKAVVLSDGPVLTPGDLPPEMQGQSGLLLSGMGSIDFNLPFKSAKKRFVQAFEKEFIERKLTEYCGNITRTAESLDMHRQSLQHKLKELSIQAKEFSD